jgi:hypothetical protein
MFIFVISMFFDNERSPVSWRNFQKLSASFFYRRSSASKMNLAAYKSNHITPHKLFSFILLR